MEEEATAPGKVDLGGGKFGFGPYYYGGEMHSVHHDCRPQWPTLLQVLPFDRNQCTEHDPSFVPFAFRQSALQI